MTTVGFDTATDDTVVAAAGSGTVRYERRYGPGESGRPQHTARLLASLEEAAAAVGGWTAVERLAVGIGPGTFTGIRIGIATALGISRSAGIPAVGISTLAALAVGIAAGLEHDGPVVPVLDARRGEIFTGLYGPGGQELAGPVVLAPEGLAGWLGQLPGHPDTGPVAGPGAVRYADEFSRAGLQVPGPESEVHHLPGRAVCQLAADPELAARPLEPLYLRVPDAQIWLQRDHPGEAPR